MAPMPQRGNATATPWQVLKAVFSAFFGVRRAAEHEAVPLKPVHLVVAGCVGAAVFVLTLLMIVWLVTRLA
jgi:hypothetical protein